MRKKERGLTTVTFMKVVIITMIIVFAIVPILISILLYALDTSLLDDAADISFIQSTMNHKQEIIMLTIGVSMIIFYFVTNAFGFGKPKQTKDLASGEWVSEDSQKDFFGIAPIDTSVELEVGGSPINLIDPHHLIYETGAVHDLCTGSTRSGKSRKIVRQLVMLASMAGESMIFNDCKKEMYQDFHIYLEKKGYDVYCLDFRFAQYSDALNPIDDINYMFEIGNIDDADQYASDQVTSLVVDNGQSEPIWIDGQKALIKAMLLETANAPVSVEKKNYYSVLQMLAVLGKEEKIDGKQQMLLSAYMDSLPETSPSRVSFTPINNSPEKTRGSFMTSALATLSPFSGIKIMKALSKSDFNFHDFTNGKKALFVVNPDEKTTYNAVTAMVFDNAYQSLIFEANKLPGRKLKKRVHMIFDEFGNMPKINNLETKITVALSRGIIYHLYLQDFKQMNEKYGENVAAIIRGNCNLKYFISSADYATCEEMSQTFGNETKWISSQGGNYNPNATVTGGNVNYNQQVRRLIDANELMNSDTLDGKDIKVHRTYLGPCKVYLPDCSEYAWYNEMEHDETEVVNEKLSLSYAIPRYIIINDNAILKNEILKGTDSDEGMSSSIEALFQSRTNGPGAKAKPELLSKDMYWYWSTRSDIGTSVTNKVIKQIQRGFINKDAESIKAYMKSEEFLTWLHDLDDQAEESKKDTVNKKQVTFPKDDESNAFEDLFS